METMEQTAEQLTTTQELRCNYLPAQLQYIIMTVHQTAPHYHDGNCVRESWRWQNLWVSLKDTWPCSNCGQSDTCIRHCPAHQQTAANHNSHKYSQCCQCWILQLNWTASHSTVCDTAVLLLVLLCGETFREIIVCLCSADSGTSTYRKWKWWHLVPSNVRYNVSTNRASNRRRM